MNDFGSRVSKRIKDAEETVTAIRRRAVERLGEEMARTKPQGGNVPFLTGNLARSLLASTEGMPKTAENFTPGNNVGLVAATLPDNQPVWIGYQANYARRVNSGYIGADSLGRIYNQQGQHFVEAAIANWPNIVQAAADEILK